jgi:hypothetical protein
LSAVTGLVLFFFFFVLDHPAETGADGVDEHQVGERQPAVLIVRKPGGRIHRLAVLAEHRPTGTHGTEMQVYRRCTGTSVEHEGDRAAAVALGDIADVEHLGLRFFLFTEDEPVGRGLVADAAAAGAQTVIARGAFRGLIIR